MSYLSLTRRIGHRSAKPARSTGVRRSLDVESENEPDGPSLAAWRFVPRPAAARSSFERPDFPTLLESVLRIGHGLGVEVSLEVRSGPEPRLMLRARDSRGARWATRILSRAYGPTQWISDPTTPPAEAPRTVHYLGHRIHDWPEPLTAPDGPSGIWDAWVGVLSVVPPGVTLRWRWTSRPTPGPHWWDFAPAQPYDVPDRWQRSGPHRKGVRPDSLRPVTKSPALFGRLGLTLTLDPSHPARNESRTVRKGIEALTRTDRGNGIVFRRMPAVLRGFEGAGHAMLLSLDEWRAFWPRPDCPAPGGGTALDQSGWLLPLGRTSSGIVVGPTLEATQGRHLAVVGETGMGKSSLLVAVGRRALLAHGGVVFDPLGETAQALHDALAPAAGERLIRIAPDEPRVGVNALEGIAPGPSADPIRSERRINDLVQGLRRVRAGRYEESSYWGPRLEEMVTRAVRVAGLLPRGTLVDAHTLLATGGRWSSPVPPPALDAARELADRIRDRPEDADGARRLLHEVVRSPVLVRMLCDPEPALRASELVAPGRIVLLSGAATSVGEATARYLLSVYLSLVWSELLAREGSSKSFVILDEAQWFTHESLGEMLRLGRRRNVHVVLATQAVASLPTAVAEAVWTNVSDFVAFRGSPEEAREFARASHGVPAEELLALPRGEAAVLLGKGHFVRWIKTIRLPAATVGSSAVGEGNASRTSHEDPAPPAASGTGRPSPDGVAGWVEPLAAVLRFLVERSRLLEPGVPLEVSLRELREEVDPSGEGVRRAGSMLSRHGALRRIGRAQDGPSWIVATDRLTECLARFPAGPDKTSDTPQPS